MIDREGFFIFIEKNKFVLNVLILYCYCILNDTTSEVKIKRNPTRFASDV